MNFILDNKNIVITGAGRGIGRIIAEVCSRKGARLCLISRTETELQETLEIVKQYNNESFYCVANICDEKIVSDCVKSILEKFGKIDVLINNAGIQSPIGVFFSNSLSEWKKNIEINLFGTINMTYFIIPSMISNKAGKIINLSGGGSTSPRPNFSAYAVSKTGIVRFTENLAEELKEFNISVNAIAPGAINTNMLDEVIKAESLAGKEYYDAVKRKETGGNDPCLAAELICFLASEYSNGITGKLISAPWDKWKDQSFIDELKNNKDLGTLRRIDNKSFYKKI